MKFEVPEWQVANFELSKRLKEVGEPQDSMWYWAIGDVEATPFVTTKEDVDDGCLNFKNPLEGEGGLQNLAFSCSAPTVAELGKRLPWNYCSGKCSPGCELGNYWCEPWRDSDVEIIYADTEANARAKMLIHLRQKGGSE